MSRQFGRAISLKVGTDAGDGLDLSELRVTFEVRNGTTSTPKYALIRVYNLAPKNMKKIVNEFTQVVLDVGYVDPGASTIFEGEIIMTRRGRNGNDTFLEISAQDADKAHNYGIINTTLAAGWTWDDFYSSLLTALTPFGVVAGNKPSFTTEKGLRGYALNGGVGAYLSILADSQNCDWYIEDSKLMFLKKDEALPGVVPSLNSSNGLLGVPDQTTDGVIITCLLRPQIRAGMMIQVNNTQLLDDGDPQAKVFQERFQSTEYVYLPDVNGNGSYKAACVTHLGDTRGEQWMTEMICVNLASAPITDVTRDAIPDAR